MPNKTTQILKEKMQAKVEKFYLNHKGIFTVGDFTDFLVEALSQQQQEDYQEVLDLELMKDEPEWESGMGIGGKDLDRECRNEFRKELRTAIAEKRGKVSKIGYMGTSGTEMSDHDY